MTTKRVICESCNEAFLVAKPIVKHPQLQVRYSSAECPECKEPIIIRWHNKFERDIE